MRLPQHPVPMTTTFRRCLLANYAVAPGVLAAALPAPLEPDVWGGQAWLSIVIADMGRMRPAGLPSALGVSYRQVVYRAVVRCGAARGVFFLRSDADSRFMNAGGNLFSFFRFHYATVDWTGAGDVQRVRVATADASADVDLQLGPGAQPSLPQSSVFPSLIEAKEHLVELFRAYHPHPRPGLVDAVRIRREDWRIAVLPVIDARCAFLDGQGPFPAGSAQLDSVFMANDLPYYWYRRHIEQVKPAATP